MKIEILDPIQSRISDKADADKIKPCLRYKGEYWKQGQYSRQQHIYDKHLIENRVFLTGLVPRITEYCRVNNIPVEITGYEQELPTWWMPELPGITFREDQVLLLSKISAYNRGVVVSPTGSGKTLLILGTMSMYPEAKVLYLCHLTSIVDQTQKELEKFGFDRTVAYRTESDVFSDSVDARIVVSTIQSFYRINPELYRNWFDVVIVDEAHHVASEDGMYAKALKNLLAPVRLGFTATPPSGDYKVLCMEGYLGPIIGEVTVQDGIEKGFLAKPVVRLISVPYNDKIGDLSGYRNIYEAVMESRIRNRLIAKEVKDRVDKGQSVLILVKEIRHGELLAEMGGAFGLDMKFVYGETKSEVRNQVKQSLIERGEKAVICTAVWKEGVNIPTLDCVVNACGGKGEIPTLQAIGRGLRVTEDKKEVEVVDFLDDYNYLARHCVKRLQIYVENGWL